MTVCIANASANFTGAATFAAAEASSLLAARQGTVTTLANNAAATSSAFTIANAAVVDGVLLWVKQGAAGSTGTFKVDLQKSGVSQASVTVNRTDLPASGNGATGAPVFFKFGSTATGDGTANWTIVVTNSNGTNTTVIAAATSTALNFTKVLRTTTAHTAAAGDDFYICKELTGAGTGNALTVTMNNTTAATQYGGTTVNTTAAAGSGIYVGFGGTLTYGSSASTNYALKLAGDLAVYEGGTFNMGTVATPIPSTSTALLNFVPTSADGDFGLIGNFNSTVVIQGVPRTAGKNVVQCLLNVDVTVPYVLSGVPTYTATQGSVALTLDATQSSVTPAPIAGNAFTDNATASAFHSVNSTQTASITNTTQIVQAWIKQGSGTHHQFVRLQMGNTGTANLTNGFFVDIDLVAGTIGTVTAVGNGTATSATISAAINGGYIVTMIGKASSGAQTPVVAVVSCSASTTTTYTGDTTQCFIVSDLNVWTASSVTTSLGVDTDTGWLSGDVIAIASTDQTAAHCSLTNLSSNATSTTLPVNTQPWTTYSGTSPIQAEVILLTRNVKIQSNSTTLTAYGFFAPTCSLTVAWAEFWNMGQNTTGKPGAIGIDCTASGSATAKSVTYCSFHDGHGSGVSLTNVTGTNSGNTTVQNCVAWNAGNFGSTVSSFGVNAALTLTDWTFDHCTSIHGGIGFGLSDLGGTLTNCVAACCGGGNGFTMLETGAAFGTFNNLTAHCCSTGISIGTSNTGTLTTVKCTRNQGAGMTIGAAYDIVVNGATIFGNGLTNLTLGVNAPHSLQMISANMGGDTTFATVDNIKFNGSMGVQLYLDSCNFGSTGIQVPCTNDFNNSLPTEIVGFVIARNTVFGTNLLSTGNNAFTNDFFIAMEKYGQTSGDHRCQMVNGQLRTDPSIFNFASPSLRMTPSSASNKMPSAPTGRGLVVPVTNGNPAAISCYLYKSKNGDGAAYNGNQPRLIQRANPALGQNSDVVLATYSNSTGSWNQLSGNTSTPTDDGAFEIIIDCDGTAGWINVDDFQAA